MTREEQREQRRARSLQGSDWVLTEGHLPRLAGVAIGWSARSGGCFSRQPTLARALLVVLDPESPEDAKRFWAAWSSATHADLFSETPMTLGELRMQAALRALANPEPPKPEEPTGLGAVVEDAEGEIWVRWTNGDGCVWRRSSRVGFSSAEYGQITAVRVLSEGVTP